MAAKKPAQAPAQTEAAAEQTYPPARFLEIARPLGRELGRPVTRGTVAGALALAEQTEPLSRTRMLALIRTYLRKGG